MTQPLKERFAKAGILPKDLAALVCDELNGQLSRTVNELRHLRIRTDAAYQRVWDELYGHILAGLAAAWEWGETRTNRVAQYAANLADAAMVERQKRFGEPTKEGR